MLDQYYKFLADRLVQWLSNRNDMKSGNKYFLLLEDNKETDSFYASLESGNYKNRIIFRSNNYNYETIGISVDKKKVLFVAPIKGITQDFLVTVRNRVNENTHEWENSCVFFIVHNALDSIVKGAYDLTQKEAPFNVLSIKKDVNKTINNSKELKEQEKQILHNYLEEISNNSYVGMNDYAVIFSILSKGNISRDEYKQLGYFYDQSLFNFNAENDFKNRLVKNREFFAQVETLHTNAANNDEIKDELEQKLLGNNLINNLSKDADWESVDFGDVYKGIEELKSIRGSKIEISQSLFDNLDDNIYWARIERTTARKNKKVHLIFSSDYFKNDKKIVIDFTENVNKMNIVDTNTFIIDSELVLKKISKISHKSKQLIIDLEDIDFKQTNGGKITYTHNNNSSLKFEIFFMIVPFELKDILNLQASFKIKVVKTKKSFFFDISNDILSYEFGPNPENIIQISNDLLVNNIDLYNCKIELSKENNFDYDGSNDLALHTKYNSNYFPVSLCDVIEKPIPLSAMSIEKERLSSDVQLVFEDDKIRVGPKVININNVYKDKLLTEEKLVEGQFLSGRVYDEEFKGLSLNIPDSLRESYINLLKFYKREKTIPSLSINSEEHLSYLKEIEGKVLEIFEGVRRDFRLTDDIRDILKIGVLYDSGDIFVTPLNPLLISYELEKSNHFMESIEIPKENILSTLNAQYLVPYLKIDDTQYRANYSKNNPRWLIYKQLEDRDITDFGKSIIRHRMNDFITQHKYLFGINENLSLNIAAINIRDHKNFFESVVRFMLDQIDRSKNLKEINPVNIYFDKISYGVESLFSILYEVKYLEHLEDNLGIKLTTNNHYDDYEVLAVLQERISIYQVKGLDFNQTDVNFHISFYQAQELKEVNIYKNYNLGKNYSLEGLINYPQFTKIDDRYANGFGLSGSSQSRSPLIKMVVRINSLVAAMNTKTDIYKNDDTLVNYISSLNYSELQTVINKSSWVTFLNLDVDLSYFFDESNGEMLVIHYTDQTTTSKYESVTITNNVSQYCSLKKKYCLI